MVFISSKDLHKIAPVSSFNEDLKGPRSFMFKNITYRSTQFPILGTNVRLILIIRYD